MIQQQMHARLLQVLMLLRVRRSQRRQLKRPRQFWVNPAYQRRIPDGEFHRIYLPIKRLAEQGDQNALRRFYQYVRMDFVAFMKLLDFLREQ